MSSDNKHAFIRAIEKLYGPRLRRFLSARLRNAAADTPDLMQEVFLRLLRIDDHDAIRNPQAYLFTVASHVLHQHMLRESSVAASVSLAEAMPMLHADEGDPAAEAETDQAFEQLGRSLQTLSPKAYATLILSRCDGMSLQEIGERLGVSRAQVKKYLARALIHVRQELNEMSRDTP